MRIYFTANQDADTKLQSRFSEIIDVLNTAGVLVMSNLAESKLTNFTPQDMERITQSGEVLLEKMDGLIIEGTKLLPDSGYLIALALTYKKPILYLNEKGKPVSQNLLHLKKDKNTANFLTIAQYTDTTLKKAITDFIQRAEQGEGREIPNIKFTLRITTRIERYLKWKTHNTKLSKADFLRSMIDRVIDEDEAFKKFLEKDRSNS